MIYHVFPGNCEHLVLNMIVFFSTKIHASYSEAKYLVLLTEEARKKDYTNNTNLTFINSKQQLIDFIHTIRQTDLVILHSTLHGIIWKYLFFRPSIWSRFIWVAWGGDFYFEDFFRPKTFRTRFRIFRQKLICKKLAAICTLVPGDYDLIAQTLGCKDKYFRAFYSPFSLKNHIMPDQWYDVNTSNIPLRILVGNSAAETNRHIEAFDFLNHFKGNEINIICPLGYPKECHDYRKLVIDKGYEYFGDKFTPILDVVAYEDYKLILDSIDILVFNHPRQQGLFNLYYALFQGKKTFLPKDSTAYAMLKEMNISVYDTASIRQLGFREFATMPIEERQLNIELAQANISEEKSIQSWKNLLCKFND